MYTWRINKFDADAEKVYHELEAHGLEDGIKPEDVVEIAKDENTELHKCFTWDDKEAAEKYRIEEARFVLRNIVIDTSQDEKAKSYERTIEVVNSGYKPVEVIIQHKDEYKELLDRAVRELKNVAKRFYMIEELSYVFDIINNI